MKRKKNRGLRRRWLTNTAGLVMVLTVILIFTVCAIFAAYYYSGMEADLKYRARSATDYVSNYVNQSYREYYQSCIAYTRSFEDKGILELQFLNARGKIVASSYSQWSGFQPTVADIVQTLETGKLSSYSGWDQMTGEHIMAVSSPMLYSNGEVVGILRYVTSLRRVDMQLIILCMICLGIGGLFVLAVVMSGNYYIKSILGPVGEIAAAAKRIASGSYGVQIQAKDDDEIGDLVTTINDMSIKISQSERTQADFITSLSHELRTPLTAITGWSETLLAGDNLDEETRRGMRIILRESRRLTDMVMELLEFSRLQDGRMTLNVENTDIRSEFEDTVYMYGSRLAQEGIRLEYLDNDDDIPEIPCDGKRMRQVFLNILDNAAKHGGEGKRIDASIHLEGRNVVIRIRDYGPGIPEEELPLVKKKFYKGSSKARGTGIGLAVCDEIVEMHGGSLTLENAQGGGTLVTISLPADQAIQIP